MKNCNYISIEMSWGFWKTYKDWPHPLEINLPFRDPIDHLLFMFNQIRREFSCDIDSQPQVKAWLAVGFEMKRFSKQLDSIENIHLKCFNNNVILT